MFKPFFIHINPHQPGKLSSRVTRGATINVSPVGDGKRVRVAVAFCSPKDQFVKAIGRKQAVEDPAYVDVIAKEKLPAFAYGTYRKCVGGDYPDDYIAQFPFYININQPFGYLLKKVKHV